MEKERFFDNSGHLMPASDQLLQPCFLNLNWDCSMDHNSQFGSSLSSVVSSPTTGAALASVVLGELIGKSVSVCNSGEISPISRQYQNSNNSTPLNSPPALNLSFHGNMPISGNFIMPPVTHLPLFSADPGFTERAARFSCFSGGNYSGPQLGSTDIPIQEPPQLRIEMKPNFGLHPARSAVTNHGQSNSAMESSASEHAVVGGGSNLRKRKAVQNGRAKDSPLSSITGELHKVAGDDNLNAKRVKSSEAMGVTKDDIKPKVEPSSIVNSADDGDQKPEKNNSSKHPEPPKQDYIHVRARRGQATDSHSLAERVRREKISERMKFLQDLVPGCNKVTGKAVMLDEIINYVQSLQRQVEFLSMKLSTVAPRLDFDVENLLHKDIHQSRGSFRRSALPAEIPSSTFPFAPQPSQSAPLQSTLTNGVENHCPVNSLESTLRKTAVAMQLPTFDGFGDFNSQTGGFWDNDLQNVVQMGFTPNQESTFSSSAFNGTLLESHMKVEH